MTINNSNTDSAVIIIDKEGQEHKIGNLEDLNIYYHADYLKEYIINHYKEELEKMKIKEGEYLKEVHAWLLNYFGDIVYLNDGKEGYLFLPNELSEKQQQKLQELENLIGDQRGYLSYDGSIIDGEPIFKEIEDEIKLKDKLQIYINSTKKKLK